MDIKLPNESIKYILFQRTGYLNDNLIFTLLSKLGKRDFLYKISIQLKSLLFANFFKEAYANNILEEYNIIKDCLPVTASKILDIGCGVAGIDVLLGKHYNNDISIFLLDKTEIERNIYYDFNKRGAFYNSLELAKKVLIKNGISPLKIKIQEVTQNNTIDFNEKFDIIISLLSWGFHYPIETYLDEVYEKLNPNGIIIIDLRKNKGSLEALKNKFNNYQIIQSEPKYDKVYAQKRI